MATTITAGNSTNNGGSFNPDNTGILEIKTGSGAGTTAITIDASQNVGVGVTPSSWSQGEAVEVGFAGNAVWSSGNNEILVSQGAYYNGGWKYGVSSIKPSYYSQFNGAYYWFTAPSGTAGSAISFGNPIMTLDASGNLMVGITAVADNPTEGLSLANIGSVGRIGIGHVTGTTTGNLYASFALGGTRIGSITQNGTTAVAYNTTSDYRLKTNVVPMQGALARVQSLKPSQFDWIDGRPDDGFIAHELQAVMPNMVVGEKDAVDENGNPEYQQVDYSRLVPTLTAAIQEQQAMIEELKAKVAALEAK